MRLKLLLAAWLFSSVILPLTLTAQNSAFTYQGRLDDGALPANGHYDLRFAIYDSVTDGNVVGNPLNQRRNSGEQWNIHRATGFWCGCF
ncbi:MAG: hypothetical protein WDN00_15095 [Limisphaerales bacterium]